MQSQQKRVKWSRGETAEALEERTDTGITQASVELMENCIPDIYGNISRRPAFKMLPAPTFIGTTQWFTYDQHLQVIPFYITETDFILIGIHYDTGVEMLRIKDGVVVARQVTSSTDFPMTKAAISNQGGTITYGYRAVSYAQQNNYMLIADSNNVYKIQLLSFETSDDSFTVSCEIWQFSAGWYAPNGTNTRTVDDQSVTGLNISGTFTNYPYTDPAGNSTIYSYTNTGVSSANLSVLETQIPVGSIIQLPKIGTYFRVEGYTFGSGNTNNLAFPADVFDGVLNANQNVPSTGKYCLAVNSAAGKGILKKYVNGVFSEQVIVSAGTTQIVQNSASLTGFSKGYFTMNHYTATTWQGWSNADPSSLNISMFGELLTPVADDSQSDSSLSVEYGYKSLQPDTWSGQTYPHPLKLAFVEQRLWAGSWAFSSTQQYSVVVGSQIARYNDLKNDYNQQNEPIELDILTNFKEKIIHLFDYNGLKIMTDSYEYAYDTKLIKQSGNGALENCEPLVFESLCLYADSTGNQIKAMQYEFQANIFNSSTINQLAPHDLIWYPIFMAAYEDKVNSTGKHLFVVNTTDITTETQKYPVLAVCNFVPSNQANIWSRWAFPSIAFGIPGYTYYYPLVHSVVNTKNNVIFMITVNTFGAGTPKIVPATLDFNANTDMEGPIYESGGSYYYAPWVGNLGDRITIRNMEVAVYANGEFQFLTTTGDQGQITDDLTGLTNITVGLPIHSKIVSHPIDVGGKTKSIKKRIAKTVMSVHDTEPGAITINGKTGYMNPQKDKINFYGVTGMKDEIKYTLTNNNGAMFHLESVLMNIEYGTLIS